ncbi:MAG: LysM peptidoglycan-binding domain-containing protein [Deltaproteobacteria bacterium]|nr:LysM peptidoglycan-binding domain-containing protein [Deltaproteobacteria bacterium]
MKKSLASILTLMFFIASCGSTPKKSSHYYKGGQSKKYSSPKKTDEDALDDIIFNNLQNRHVGGVHYSKYLNQNKKWDIPYTHNEYVQKWINYYTGKGRKHLTRHLARSGRYIPYIHQVLAQYGMPKDIAYLSMIESGFNVRAKSWASAVGPWQFIRSTGAMYGLNVDYYVDERRDPEKATHAAARHLKDLYNEFGDWYLAFAAYNAGSGKVRGAIRRDGNNYWDMVRGSYLRQETKDYVPKLLAAAEIAKNPEKYGFTNIRYQSYIPMDVVYMKGPTDLEVAAECAGVDPDLIRLLNPELLHDITPPHISNYALKIPKGTKSQFQKQYAALKPHQRSRTVFYTTQKGDTVNSVASRYGVSIQNLVKANPGKIQTNKSYQTKKVKVSVKRGKRTRYVWRNKKYDVYSYQVNPGLRLTIPKDRSLKDYSSLRDDEAAVRAQGKYAGSPSSRVASSAASAAPSSKGQQNRENEIERVESSTQQAWQVKDSVLETINQSTTQSSTKNPGKPVRTDLPPSTGSTTQNSSAGPTSFPREDEFYSLAPRTNAQPSEDQLREAVLQLQEDSASDTQANEDVAGEDIADEEEEVESSPPKVSAVKAKQPPAPRAKDKIQYHQVKSGETLTGIATLYGVSMEDLKLWNGSKVHPVLLSGVKLQIRNGKEIAKPKPVTEKTRSGFYTVKSGDNLNQIAQQFGVSTSQLKEWNGRKVSPVLQAGAKILVSKKSEVVKYKVKPGDNLTIIARKHNTTPEEIKKLNNLKGHVIRPGSVLIVKN